MGSALLITLREGFEVSLVLAILITYLIRTDRRAAVRQVWLGTGIAAAICIALGVAINAAVGGLNGKVEQAVEGTIAIAACAILTWMIFWMRRNAVSMGADLRARLADASSAGAVVVVALVAVIREGLETVLFLLSARTEGENASGTSVVIGGLIGLAIAAALGWLVYLGGARINKRLFFSITGVLLILFAAGLFGKAFHEYRELVGAESGWLVSSAWNVESGPFASGTFYDFMKGFFGWSADAERGRVITYFVYLVPVLVLFLRNGGRKQSGMGAASEGRETAVAGGHAAFSG